MEHYLGWAALAVGVAATLMIGTRNPSIALALGVAYLVRSCAALFHFYISPLPDGTADAVTYERLAWQWSQSGVVEVLRSIPTVDSYLTAKIIGLIYALTDRSPLMAQSLSVWIGTGSVYLAYRLSCVMWDRNAAVKAVWVAALFPTLVLYSALTMREPYIWFFFLLGMLGVTYWSSGQTKKGILIAVGGFTASTFFHGGMLFALLGFLVLLGYRSIREFSRRLHVGYIRPIAALIFIISLGTVGSYAMGMYEVPKLGSVNDLFDGQRVLERFERSGRDTARYPDWLVPESPLEIPVLAPVRGIYFLFAPFPWDIRAIRHLLGLLDGLLYVALTYLLWRNRKYIWSNDEARSVLLVALPVLFLFAVAIGNFGTGIRHRAKLVGVAIVLVSPLLPRLVVDSDGTKEVSC